MHVGFAFRIEANTREEAYQIYKYLCLDDHLCFEDCHEEGSEYGMWDYCYGPKPLYDEPNADQENTYWSDDEGTNVYNGITWEEFKNQNISTQKLNEMFEGFLIVSVDWNLENVSANTFNSFPPDNLAWVFVTCSHI